MSDVQAVRMSDGGGETWRFLDFLGSLVSWVAGGVWAADYWRGLCGAAGGTRTGRAVDTPPPCTSDTWQH